MELSIIKIEPILEEIKKENDSEKDVCNFYNEEQSHEARGPSIFNDDIEVKLEFNSLSETNCKHNVGANCECSTCFCEAEHIGPFNRDNIFNNNNAKLEESDHKNVLQNDDDTSSLINDPYLVAIDCYDYVDEKLFNISETTGFGSVSAFNQDQKYLGSETRTEKQFKNCLLDPHTGQKVELKELVVPLVNLKYRIKPLNSDKFFNSNEDLTTSLVMVVEHGNSKPATYECSRNQVPTNKKGRCRENHGNRKLHLCPSCQKSFTIKRNLDSHILNKHSNDHNLLRTISNTIYDCPKCKKQFLSKSNLDTHVNNHKNYKNAGKDHNCVKCQRQFSTKLLLGNHIISKHSNDKNLLKTISYKIYECPKCDKQFVQKYYLDAHIITNHENDKSLLETISTKSHICPKCNKTFSKKLHLSNHVMSIHNNDKSLLKTVSSKVYDCPKCSRQFIYKYRFDSHILSSHSNDENLRKMITSKIHDCPKCDKKFINKCEMIKHVIRNHKDVQDSWKTGTSKIYDCTKCKKQFCRKSSLDRHIINSHNDDNNLRKMITTKLYDCPKCSKQYINKCDIVTHIKRYHNDDHAELTATISSR